MTHINLLTSKVSFLRSRYLLSDIAFSTSTSPSTEIFSPRADLYLVTCSEFVNSEEFLHEPRPSSGTVPRAAVGLLTWELVRLFDSGQPKTEAVLWYLAKAEAREVNPHLADDLRLAWLTVLNAAQGQCDAWGYSFWTMFGKTYPKALKAWAKRDEINRKALERTAAMIRSQQIPVASPTGGEAAGKQEVPKPHGNLYDSAREILNSKKPMQAVKRDGKKVA